MLISNVVKLVLLGLSVVPFFMFQYNPDQGWRLLLMGLIIGLQFVWGWFYSAKMLSKPTNKSSVRNHANGIKRRSPYWAAFALFVMVWGIVEWAYEVIESLTQINFLAGFSIFAVLGVGMYLAGQFSQRISAHQKQQQRM